MEIKKLSTHNFFKKGGVTLLIMIFARLAKFLFWLFMARMFVSAIVGQLIFGVTLSTVIANICILGSSIVIAREWGYRKDPYEKKIKEIHHILNGYFYKGASLVFVAIICGYVLLRIFGHHDFAQINLYLIFLSLPFFVLLLARGYLIGVQKVYWGNCIDLLLNCCLMLPAFIFYLLSFHHLTLLVSVIFCLLMGASFILVATSWLKFGAQSASAAGNNFSLILMRLGNLLYSFVDMGVLKVFASSVAIAHYGIAQQFCIMISFCVNALSHNMMAFIANSYKHETKKKFQASVFLFTKFMFVFTIIPVVLLAGIAPIFLKLYGSSYEASYPILLILLSGYLVVGFLGNGTMILSMAGYEKIIAMTFFVCIIINLFLAVILVHIWQGIGVAISTAIGMILWNLILCCCIKKKLGVNASLFYYMHLLIGK